MLTVMFPLVKSLAFDRSRVVKVITSVCTLTIPYKEFHKAEFSDASMLPVASALHLIISSTILPFEASDACWSSADLFKYEYNILHCISVTTSYENWNGAALASQVEMVLPHRSLWNSYNKKII